MEEGDGQVLIIIQHIRQPIEQAGLFQRVADHLAILSVDEHEVILAFVFYLGHPNGE